MEELNEVEMEEQVGGETIFCDNDDDDGDNNDDDDDDDGDNNNNDDDDMDHADIYINILTNDLTFISLYCCRRC